MGEYIRHNGEHVKLGTCEDLYYGTHAQVAAIVGAAEQIPGNLPPEEYLDRAAGWRYRFPFPDEDDVTVGTHKDFDRGVVLPVPPDCPVAMAPDGHGSGSHGFHVHNVYRVNVCVPCPASGKLAALELRTSDLPGGIVPVEIVQQKLLADGRLAPVLRCGWCGERWRIEGEEVAWLVAFIREQPGCIAGIHHESRARFWRTIADRIEAGYPVTEAVA